MAVDQDTDHIKAVVLSRPAVPPNPRDSGPRQLALFSPIDSLDRIAEVGAVSRFDLNKRYEPLPLDDEVNVSAS